MGGNGRPRWKISFHRNSSSSKPQPKDPPVEFLCPISRSLIAEPVVVASGQTFESVSVQVCRDLGFTPKLEDGSTPNFSAVIPNLALKSTISNWCVKSGVEKPHPPEYSSVERIVRTAMPSPRRENQESVSDRELLKAMVDNPPVIFSHAATELGPQANPFQTSSSDSVCCPETPLPLATRPTCYSSSSSSVEINDNELRSPIGPISEEEEKLVLKLRSDEVSEQEGAVVSLRNITKTREDTRISLCTPALLSSLRSLILSEHPVVQVNAVASLVNFSLEKSNKVKIVRSGFIPSLIVVLKSGFPEAQEHAAGALFSLALDDENKMAIGVLGALEPLMNALRSESERARQDSALALYHLTLVQSNRVKLVKLGAVPTLLSMVKSGDLASRVLLILCNIAAGTEGRTAMLDANGVECLVGVLRENKSAAEAATTEHCVAALYGMSHGSLRFKALAKEARAVEVLREVEERGSGRAREKAKRMLQMMRAGGEEDDENGGGSDEALDSSGLGRTRFRVGGGRNVSTANTTSF
ncbi:hypothetical protein QN277_006740 [Acacia crassicarpa]|uniref:RING-type E3 ubiquitin transferase n=1 Tax=Acacia crassicarpa TaxID=499986 RepID=A0AAE1MC54_9FABA|nr:hypothetical protein QN277_006740 [Acacia crassicarpa]